MKAKKTKSGFEKHLVPCPNCGRDILDHMTQCPFCKAEVTPSAYQPADPEKLKKVRLYLTIALCIVAALLLFFARCGSI